MPFSVRDPAKLFNVDVDHLSGPGIFIPAGLGPSADPDPVTGSVNRGGGHRQRVRIRWTGGMFRCR
jgi:hypothetical protein